MADFEAIFELDDIDKIDCIFDITATVYSYPELADLPQINGETLIGNKTSEELHLASAEGLAGLSSALDFETQARETADVNIHNRIDTIVESFDGDIERLEQNIQNEATTRAENDTLLQNDINTLDEKVDGINVNLTAQIDNLEQDVNDKYNELIRDIDDLTGVVEEDYNTLNTKIDATSTTINQRITDVADELNQTIEENVVALQQEDTALQNQINAHSQTLTGYDTRITNNTNAITQEIADRQAGDNTLQEQVNDNKNLIDTKQDIINDLSTIRSNAQAGYDIIPQVQSNTQRIEDLTVARFPNAIIVGTPHIEGGQVSGFSDSNYLQFPFVDISRGLPFDIYFSFTTSNDVNTQQNILDAYFGIALAIQNGKGIMALSSNGTSWDIGMATGTNTLLPNTTYFVKYSWTGTAYSAALSTDDQTYIPDMNLTSSLSPYKTTIFIGGSPNLFGPGSAHPFKGTINFNKSKVVVNGITVWEGMADVGLASRANVSLTNLDEVGENRFNEKQNVTDNALVTLDKTVVGAVNELDAKIKDIQLFKFPDATIIGTPTINNGQVTNFSSNNYLILPFAFDTKDRAFEINMAFTTGSNVSTTQNLLGGNYCLALLIEGGKLVFRASNNSTSWNVADITTTLTLQASTNYFVKIYFDKLSYKISYSTNGEDYTQVGYKVTTETPRHGQVFIGVGNNQHNPFLGIINLNRCNIKLNTSIIWQGMDDAGLATRADISLSNLDELGQAKFDAKQDTLTAGTGIKIENNVISNTQTSAEWGNIQGELSNQTDLKTALDSKQATISDLDTIRSKANNSVYYNTITNKGLYLATHPELISQSVIIPFIHNDIAYLVERGGSYAITRDGQPLTPSTALNMFNGKPNYLILDGSTGTEWVIDVTLPPNVDGNTSNKYLYGNVIYIDFGRNSWASKYVKIEYQLRGSETYTQAKLETNNSASAVYVYVSAGATGLGAIRFTLREPATTTSTSGFRIAQIGVINYQSNGTQSTLLGLGGGTLYGDVTFASGGLTGYQKTIADLETIREGASKGATALQNIPIAKANVVGGVACGNWLTVNQTTGKMECGELTKAQYDSALGYTFISKTTLNNVLVDKQNKLTAGDNITIENDVISAKASGGLEVGDIGLSIFVDESKGLRRYLNGSIVAINTNTQAFLDRLKQVVALYPSIACTESEWQSIKTMSAFGQCGKFVIDETAGTIRLPRIVMPIQGLTNLTKLGEIVEQGLPNITGDITNVRWHSASKTATGCFAKTTEVSANLQNFWQNTKNSDSGTLIFSASDSSSIYKDGSNVQQEQIQYPYFIQIANGQETQVDIVNEIELNNPYSLGDSKYSPNELNNISWLASNGQWNSGDVYVDFYNAYAGKIGQPFRNGTVKASTDSYTDYDLVINASDKTFRLPLLDGSEDLVSDKYDNLILQDSGSEYTAPANGWYYLRKFTNAVNQFIGLYNRNNGIASEVVNPLNNMDSAIHIPVKKDDNVACFYTMGGATQEFRFIYAKGNGTLYFYVGETVQNANLIDAGRIAEQLTNKVDVDSSWGFPSSRYVNLSFTHSAQYIAPANGWYTIRGWVSSPSFNSVMGFANNTSNLFMMNQLAGAENSQRGISIPAKKGDIVTALGYGATITLFRFVYAEGAN